MNNDLFELNVNSVNELDDNSMLRILENRHNLMVEWLETVAAVASTGINSTAIVTVRATVHDCINIQRLINKQKNLLNNNQMHPSAGEDSRLLYDFMCSHQATISPARF